MVRHHAAYLLAALHPERVAAAVMIGTIVNVGGWDDYPLAQAMACCDVDLGEDRDEGWDRCSRQPVARDFAGFRRVLRGRGDERSARHEVVRRRRRVEQRDDARGAGRDPRRPTWRTRPRWRNASDRCRRIGCPVLVVHGNEDRVTSVHRPFARTLLRAPIVENDGYAPRPATRPGNRLLRQFIEDTVLSDGATDDPGPGHGATAPRSHAGPGGGNDPGAAGAPAGDDHDPRMPRPLPRPQAAPASEFGDSQTMVSVAPSAASAASPSAR